MARSTTKKNHYEVIGVDSSATPEEIKKAYRAKTKEVHPDKGGTIGGREEEMIDLNVAYTTLSNPERRLLYDRTGEDKISDINNEVRSIIFEFFQEALVKEKSDVLGHAKDRISKRRDELEQQKYEVKKEQEKLQKRRDKISLKKSRNKNKKKEIEEKPNLFHILVDQHLQAMEGIIASCERGMEVMTLALKELQDYESKEAQEIIFKPTSGLRMQSFYTSS